jgi:hypothetical protein
MIVACVEVLLKLLSKTTLDSKKTVTDSDMAESMVRHILTKNKIKGA